MKLIDSFIYFLSYYYDKSLKKYTNVSKIGSKD